jgi:myosin heavy subunit
MQIQYNITRIEEWCKSHDMPDGTLQLEPLMQATKLLQLKKATTADLEVAYDADPAHMRELPRRRLRGASPGASS